MSSAVIVRQIRRGVFWSIVMATCAMLTGCASMVQSTEDSRPPHLLVFSRTEGFRHDSIPAGIDALRELAQSHDMPITATEDSFVFEAPELVGVDVVVFLNTTGDVLNQHQQNVLRQYIEEGGGFVGIHAAADTEHDWPWYRELIGARFESHPQVQSAVVEVVDAEHPSTRHLPAAHSRVDEWYNFDRVPEEKVDILLTLDVESYEGSTMGSTHPIAWCSEVGRGRSFYTGFGHTAEAFDEPLFRQHLLGGIFWAARATDLLKEPSEK